LTGFCDGRSVPYTASAAEASTIMTFPIDIRVQCYSGYRGEEIPRAVWMGVRRIAVAEILDRWLAPDHRYFKFRGDDEGIYIIRHDVVGLNWQMTFFQDRTVDAAGSVRPPSGNA
jgi:hypothetical protein